MSRPGPSEEALLCGVDEAGRGCLAGPIFAAAVILDPSCPIDGLADSKQISPERRSELASEIRAKALAYGIAWASVAEIDGRGIEWANRIVFSRAVRDLLRRFPHLKERPIALHIDGNRRAWRLGMPQVTVVRGDATVPAISAASILAKTSRDAYVVEVMHPYYPHFGFDAHKGYTTRAHVEALVAWGPTRFHRRTFKVRRLSASGEEPGAEASGVAGAP